MYQTRAKVKRCSTKGCTNRIQKGAVCVRHGANSNEGCTDKVKKGGVCIGHDAKVKKVNRYTCSHEGCTNIAHIGGVVVKGGVCIEHGAERNMCSYEGFINVMGEFALTWRESQAL